MQYFISAENSSYFYWQLELLIESFLMQGLEKDLVIGLAENDSQKIRGYSSNVVKYGKKFIHPNEGREIGYLPINRVNAIRYALAYKILKFPFVLIHADMILRNPITISEEDSKYGIIINGYEEIAEDDLNYIKSKIKPEIEKAAEERQIESSLFPEVPAFSAPIVFNECFEYVSDFFFYKLKTNTLNMLDKYGKNFPCERAALEQTIMESFQHSLIKATLMAGPLLCDEEKMNFIHYKTGIPPVFNKRFYKFEDKTTYYNPNGPYETILDHNQTVNTNYLINIIRSYKKRNNK